MKKNTIRLAYILTYSGTLPLILSAFVIYMPILGINGLFIANTYSAIIIAFLSGIHWAAHIFFPDKCPRYLLLTSNIVALIAWLSLLLPQQTIILLLQALCFIYMLTLDTTLRDAGIMPTWFYPLRRNATIIVVLSLLAIAGIS